jgi:hypothetical protein
MDLAMVLFILFMVGIVFGFFGAWISGEKGRDRNQGMAIGFLFGPLGCLILALLPAKEEAARQRRSGRGDDWDDRSDDFRVPEVWGKPKPSEEESNVLRYLNGETPKLEVLSWTKDGAARCKCPCGYPVQVPRDQLGKIVVCSTCRHQVLAPEPTHRSSPTRPPTA